MKTYPRYRHSNSSWLGDVPDHWETEWLKWGLEVSREKNETAPVGKMLSVSGYRGIEEKEYESERLMRTTEELESYRVVRKGQLVVNTMWLNYAGLGVSDFEGHVSPAYRCYWVGPKYNKRYLHHLLRSDVYVNRYKQLMYGIRPNSLQVSAYDFDHLDLLVPPFGEQEKIVDYLDYMTGKLDKLITQKQRLIELLKEKRQSIIVHVTTKGLNDKAKMRDSGVIWLGQIPSHWEIKKLKYLSKFYSGGTPSKDNIFYWNGEIPWVSSKDVKKDYLDDTEDHINENAIKESATTLLPKNSLVMVVRSGILQRMIPIAVLNREMTINQDIRGIITDSERLLSPYLAAVISSNQDVLLAMWRKVGATVESLEHEDYSNTPMPVPPLKEQNEIITYTKVIAKQIDDLIFKTKLSIERLTEYRHSLISASVTGKIDLRDWKIA